MNQRAESLTKEHYQSRFSDTQNAPQDVQISQGQRLMYAIYAVVASLLIVRVFISLTIANQSNSFSNLMYSVTQPFVAPFKGLFQINSSLSNGTRLEVETLFALLTYGLITWLIIRFLDGSESTTDIS